MQNLYFNFFFLLSFFIFIINPSFSENETPSLDLNEKQKTIVDNALSSCSDVNFENLLNSRKEKLGVNEPDKSINKICFDNNIVQKNIYESNREIFC